MVVKDIVLSFLRTKNNIPGESETEQLACEYLDHGILDSLGIVEMVAEFERILNIRFSAEDMQSEEFRTIGGLILLIENLRKAGTL
jgi:acyl carrier protein